MGNRHTSGNQGDKKKAIASKQQPDKKRTLAGVLVFGIAVPALGVYVATLTIGVVRGISLGCAVVAGTWAVHLAWQRAHKTVISMIGFSGIALGLFWGAGALDIYKESRKGGSPSGPMPHRMSSLAANLFDHSVADMYLRQYIGEYPTATPQVRAS